MLATHALNLFGNRTGVSASNEWQQSPFGPKSFCRRTLRKVAKLDAHLRWIVGMNAPRRLAALIIIGSMFFTSTLFAESTSATMSVSVQVLARAIVTIDSQPATVEISSDDIARGYVDVESPILVRVRTNSRSGYLLHVANVNETFSSVELTSSDIDLHVSSHESWIQRPYVSGGDVMPLHARLRLSAGAMPGAVAMPISFSASPL